MHTFDGRTYRWTHNLMSLVCAGIPCSAEKIKTSSAHWRPYKVNNCHRLLTVSWQTLQTLPEKWRNTVTAYRSLLVNRLDDKLLVAERNVANFTPRKADLWCQPEPTSATLTSVLSQIGTSVGIMFCVIYRIHKPMLGKDGCIWHSLTILSILQWHGNGTRRNCTVEDLVVRCERGYEMLYHVPTRCTVCEQMDKKDQMRQLNNPDLSAMAIKQGCVCYNFISCN